MLVCINTDGRRCISLVRISLDVLDFSFSGLKPINMTVSVAYVNRIKTNLKPNSTSCVIWYRWTDSSSLSQVHHVWRPGSRLPGPVRWRLDSEPLSHVSPLASQAASTPGPFWDARSTGVHCPGHKIDWTVQWNYSVMCSIQKQGSPTLWPPL